MRSEAVEFGSSTGNLLFLHLAVPTIVAALFPFLPGRPYSSAAPSRHDAARLTEAGSLRLKRLVRL
jgi:hypothetical protein